MDFIIQWIQGILSLFLDMSPYLLLGFTVSGALSLLLKSSFVAKHVGKPGILSVIKASLLGVPLPLCSCGVIPTASFFKKSGSSSPALVSFLISTPQTGIDSIAATYGLLGPFLAIVRPVAAFITGIFGGLLTSFFGEPFSPKRSEPSPMRTPNPLSALTPGSFQPLSLTNTPPIPTTAEKARATEKLSFWKRTKKALHFAYRESVDDIALPFLAGLAIAALITLVIPQDFFAGSWFASGVGGMVLMVLVGVPIYICSTSSIPVALALIATGISPGAAYVFLIAGPATNAASIMVLGKVLGQKNLILYLTSIILGSIFTGFIIDGILGFTGWEVLTVQTHEHHQDASLWITIVFGFLLAGLLLTSLYHRFKPKPKLLQPHKINSSQGSGWEMGIGGMDCQNCALKVKTILEEVKGISHIQIQLDRGILRYHGPAEIKDVIGKIKDSGYRVVEPRS